MIFTVLLFWFCAGADLSDTLMDRMVKPEWVLQLDHGCFTQQLICTNARNHTCGTYCHVPVDYVFMCPIEINCYANLNISINVSYFSVVMNYYDDNTA